MPAEDGTSQLTDDPSSMTEQANQRSNAWLVVLAVGVLATGLYFLPSLDPHGRAIVYLATEAAAIITVFATLRLHRRARGLAWTLFGFGMVAVAIGDALWFWFVLVTQETPSASLADVFYLAEYPLLVAGVMLLFRGRPDRISVLDTLIATTAAAVVVFEFIVRPELEGYSGTPLDLAVLLAYPIADIALLAVALRLAFTGNQRSPVLRLVVGGIALTFFADLSSLWIGLIGVVPDPSPLDAMYLIAMTMWGAAAVHPAARRELVAGGTDWIGRGIERRIVIAAALLLVPATLAVEASTGSQTNVPVLLAAWGAIVVLVILRMEAGLAQAYQSEERFRVIFEDAPAGMTMTRAGRLVHANRTTRSMFGIGLAGIHERSLLDFVAPEDRQRMIDRLRRRSAGQEPEEFHEMVGVRRDGSRFPALLSTREIGLPDGPATISFVMDVSEQKYAEQTLRESERRYRELFDNNPHPMWIFDPDTLRVLEANRTAVERYGWSVEEFRAMQVTDIRTPEERPTHAEYIQIDTSPMSSPIATRHLHADGSMVQVEVTTRSLIWAGRPARLVLAEDVTDRVRLEDSLRQAQKMEAVGRLAGGVAHDFNNLLTAISGYGQLLRDELGPEDERIGEVDEILLASGRAAGLTRQLLAFSRQQVLQPRMVDINASIGEIRGMLARLLGEDLQLRIELDQRLGPVRIDPGQLTQVLLNLAVNARDAMPRGGTLTIETRSMTLDRESADAHEDALPGPYALLRVSDTGAGMDGETLQHVFEPFFTTKEVGKGTGLGLATVYGIVRQSDGTIEVHSEPGIGTTFEILLPTASDPDQERDGVETTEPMPRGFEAILVVEDEPAVRKFAISVLQRAGYTILAADGPDQAASIAAEYPGPIDLLLTDVIMPGGNGTDLASRVSEIRPRTRALMMTGYARDTMANRGNVDDDACVIEKPFGPSELLVRVRATLDAN